MFYRQGSKDLMGKMLSFVYRNYLNPPNPVRSVLMNILWTGKLGHPEVR